MKRITSHAIFPINIDDSPVTFIYNGKKIKALKSDTVASALYFTGVKVFSRSFKYHRPRGLYDNYGMGPEVLLTIDNIPNVPSDLVPVHEGMVVKSQNAFPSTKLDLMAINDFAIPLLPNGFYYKMFHKPAWLWPIAERFIRKAAGLGKINTSLEGTEKRYEKIYKFPHVCVIGGGPAGLGAAKGALDQGRKVLLIDECSELGGRSVHTITRITNCSNQSINQKREFEAVTILISEIKDNPNLEILTDTTVFSIYEENLVTANNNDELFKIRAETVVVATGASDRHLVFENNDFPGIMLGRGVERLIACQRIKPGEKAVVVTTHNGGYETAQILEGAGTQVLAIIDARKELTETSAVASIKKMGIPVYTGETIHRVKGKKALKEVTTGSIDGKKEYHKFKVDLAIVAVGYKPTLDLLSIGEYKPFWDEERMILTMDSLPENVYAAGDVNGHAPFSKIYQEGYDAGKNAAFHNPSGGSTRSKEDNIYALPADIPSKGNNHFICKCMDVTRKEACLSIEEGYDQIETLKRYTSMGMGPCQGKLCHEAVARLAAIDCELHQNKIMPTTMRPPYRPVSFGILAGRSHHLVPVRRTAMHFWHTNNNATFLNVGQWKRPHSYRETFDEVMHVRNSLGIVDISTLGKISISGPDALNFIHFMLPGKFKKLEVGKTRYSIMVGEDGILFEDGTISKVEEGEYYISTTTGNQEAIISLFWWWKTTEDFDVHIKNLGPVLAALNISGQRSREFLEKHVDIDISNKAFPYMSCRKTMIANVPVTFFRIGFTGELSYELHYPSEFGESLWEYLMDKGGEYDLKPFGIESQRILRLEKGHLIPGVDTDALSNPYEAGVGFTIKDDKEDFIGKAFLNNFKERGMENRLVPYVLDKGVPIPADGAAIIHEGKLGGRVTSSRFSPTLGHGVGLGWVPYSISKSGDVFTIQMVNHKNITGKVIDHAAYDPEGALLRS